MACPIGFAKGEQKYECCYATIVNLPPRIRYQTDSILLVEVTNSKAFKRYGAARVISGVDSNGKQVEEDNFAADMRRLREGIILDIPKADGGTRKIKLQAWLVGFSADFPAAGACLPFMESTSAHVWCRECDCNFASQGEQRPFIFADRQQQQKRGLNHNGGCCAPPGRLRSRVALKAEINRLRDLKRQGKDVSKQMQQDRVRTRISG